MQVFPVIELVMQLDKDGPQMFPECFDSLQESLEQSLIASQRIPVSNPFVKLGTEFEIKTLGPLCPFGDLVRAVDGIMGGIQFHRIKMLDIMTQELLFRRAGRIKLVHPFRSPPLGHSHIDLSRGWGTGQDGLIPWWLCGKAKVHLINL